MKIKRRILIFELLFVSFLTLSCTDTSKKASLIENEDFKGLIIVDEINALKSGEKILKDNGNAVDAAVSMALTLGVSLPSRVSYSSLGICKVANSSGVNVYDFRKDNTFIRAMSLMQTENGNLVFSSLASKPEAMANLGIIPDDILIDDMKNAKNIPSVYQETIKDDTLFINHGVLDIITKIRIDPIFGYYDKEKYKELNLNDALYNNTPDVYKDNNFTSNALLPPATTEFVVIDRKGMVVACSLSLGEFFGGDETIKGVRTPLKDKELSPDLKILLKNGFVNVIETSKSDKIVCDAMMACHFEMKTPAYKIRVVK